MAEKLPKSDDLLSAPTLKELQRELHQCDKELSLTFVQAHERELLRARRRAVALRIHNGEFAPEPEDGQGSLL